MKTSWQPGANVQSGPVSLRSLTFDLAGAFGQNLNVTSATNLVLDGVTVKNAQANHGIVLTGGSQLGFGATAPSFITGNQCSGILVGAGSLAILANVTLSGNGQANCGYRGKQGITAERGGAVLLRNYVIGAGGSRQAADVNITGNFEHGIVMDGGSFNTDAEGDLDLVHVFNNPGLGAEINGASGEIVGRVRFEGNGSNPDEFGPSAQLSVFGSGWSTTVNATCPGGKVVMGGGASSANPNIVVASSLPTSSTEWTVVFRNSVNSSQIGEVVVSAICAAAQ